MPGPPCSFAMSVLSCAWTSSVRKTKARWCAPATVCRHRWKSAKSLMIMLSASRMPNVCWLLPSTIITSASTMPPKTMMSSWLNPISCLSGLPGAVKRCWRKRWRVFSTYHSPWPTPPRLLRPVMWARMLKTLFSNCCNLPIIMWSVPSAVSFILMRSIKSAARPIIPPSPVMYRAKVFSRRY